MKAICLFALITTAGTLLGDPPCADNSVAKPLPSQVPQTFDGSATVQIAVDVSIFAVSEERALGLLADLRNPAKIAETEQRLEAMAAKKEAQLLAWPHLTATSGQRAHSETMNELRYPTEFDPPASPAGNDDAEAVSGPDAKPKLIGKRAMPTAFETRDLGLQLEIAPFLSDDAQRIVLAVTFSWVQLRGWDTFTGQVWQPDFVSLKGNGTFVLHSGVPHLLGIHRLETPANHIAILIVRATAEKGAQ